MAGNMTAIILCSRAGSSRVPGKCFTKYNGITQIEHLIKRLINTNLPIYVAVPATDVSLYMFLMDKYPKRVFVSSGFDDNPLARTYAVAKQNNIDTILRLTHDKIFVDTDLIDIFLDEFKIKNLSYIYSSNFIPGTGFEIISFDAIKKAVEKFPKQKVEHISYAVKAVTTNSLNYEMPRLDFDLRLLIDYQEDVKLMDIIFSTLGSDCTLKDVIELVENNLWLTRVNKLPKVTIYTCAYNAEKWIDECMGSVSMQDGFKNYEYILIDDYSTDKTVFKMGKFSQNYKNVKFYKNFVNSGLSTSSNRALKLAKGEYIIRLDADDYFSSRTSINELIDHIESNKLDIVYPDCYAGVGQKRIQKGSEKNHVGGAIYKTSALNHIKFTDRLRNHDSLDTFLRAKDQLKIGYLEKPLFVYRQTPGSMSRTNLVERDKVKDMLLETHG